MNLDAYFSRVGFTGQAAADLATLRTLHRLHIEAIPFENLDVLLGQRIDMSEEAVERKIVAGRRGGYFFEQNTLFRGALNALGFGTAEKRELGAHAELLELLTSRYGLTFPAGTVFKAPALSWPD